MELKGKVALVTGGSRGIGRAVCERFLREGASVVAAARRAEPLHQVTRALEKYGAVRGIPADVSRAEDVEHLVTKAVETFGRIDVLVNNAAILGSLGDFTETSGQDWDLVMDTNLKGAFLCTREALPRMPPEGSIVNVTSGLARDPSPNYFPYSLSKWGVDGLTRAMARAVPQRVNAVDPGLVRSDMTEFSGTPPEEVTGVFVFLASQASRGVTGRILQARDYKDFGLAKAGGT